MATSNRSFKTRWLHLFLSSKYVRGQKRVSFDHLGLKPSLGAVLLPKKLGVSFSGSFSRQNKEPHETFAIEKTDLGVSWPGRNWPTGPSERQLPTGSLAQMALEANWEAKTKAKFLLVRSREKLGF